jgi:2-dehydro-3-deoxyphosphogluconate aldolase / (4S)-4-hydroxy-2-oxoglutarate aldolase
VSHSTEIPEALSAGRVVAVLRASTAEYFQASAEVLMEQGIQAIEVTLTTEGGLEALRSITASAPKDVAVGAGSVMSVSQVSDAAQAGAQFLVSPVTQPDVLAAGRLAGLPTYPGAFSPTEILAAHDAGAPLVKLFPASTVGPGYIKDLHGPMPQVEIMPTGGIGLADIGAWLAAGALAVGMGTPLLGDALRGGSLDDLADRARRAVSAVRGAERAP